MNYIYFGLAQDINIGNGKTVSAVKQIMTEHLLEGKVIFSNIKLNEVPYTEFTPDNVYEVLETENAIVLFDEIHAILYKNHRIHEGCGKHSIKGLCYLLVEFFRQVRKKDIDTISTSQLFSDSHFQLRNVMQEMILCEKFHVVGNQLVKCPAKNRCPADHNHIIKQVNYRTGEEKYFNPKRYYDLYNSEEIVKGWVSYD